MQKPGRVRDQTPDGTACTSNSLLEGLMTVNEGIFKRNGPWEWDTVAVADTTRHP